MDCFSGVFGRGRSWIARFYCLVFFAFLLAPLVAVLLVARDSAHVGIGLLYGTVAIAWGLIVQVPGQTTRARLATTGQPSAPTNSDVIGLLLIHALELSLGLSVGWWNDAWPDGLRALGWGVLMPVGVADIVASSLTLVLARFDGYPVYPAGSGTG